MTTSDIGINFSDRTVTMCCLECYRIDTFTFEYLWYSLISRVEIQCRKCWHSEWTHNWQGIIKRKMYNG